MEDETVQRSHCSHWDNLEYEEETKAFNFLGLPREIQRLICHQMDFSSYNNLMKTSKKVRQMKLAAETHLFEKKVDGAIYHPILLCVEFYVDRHGFTWEKIAPSPVTIVLEYLTIKDPLTDEGFIHLFNIFKAKRLKIEVLNMECRWDLENMENVLNLIHIAKPTMFDTSEVWPDTFFADDRMKSVTELCALHAYYPEETFFSLKIQTVRLYGLALPTNSIRKWLMEFYEGSRTVDDVHVGYNSRLLNDSDQYEMMTRDILLPIWTHATHHLSLLKDYKISELKKWYMPQMFYLFPRDSKGLEYYNVQFYQFHVRVTRTSEIYFGYLDCLPCEVALKLFKKISKCDKTYCEHKKWCLDRFRKGYPIAYKRFIIGLYISEIVVTGLCLNTTIVRPKWFLKRKPYLYTSFFGFERPNWNYITRLLEIF